MIKSSLAWLMVLSVYAWPLALQAEPACGSMATGSCSMAKPADCKAASDGMLKTAGCIKKEGCCMKNAAMKAPIATVDTEGLKKLLASDQAVVVLDARSGKWDDGKRIAAAKSLNATSSDEEIAKVLPAKDAKIVTYCAGVKCPASNALAERLVKLGYVNITEYPEGIAGWVAGGNAVKGGN